MAKLVIRRDFEIASELLEDEEFRRREGRKEKEDIGKLKLLKARLENIDFELEVAERICGDDGVFPYRSSYFLTRFFQDLGHDFSHDGSTRRYWVQSVLEQLNIEELADVIKVGLFRRRDFDKLDTKVCKEGGTVDQAIEIAKKDFRKLIDDSIRGNEVIELSDILGLSVNIELMFDSVPNTKDVTLNQLIEDAKNRFLRPGDKGIALEKLWDAFERLKTYFSENKRASSDRLIDSITTDLERESIEDEFRLLTKIGNTYQIRHHEIDKRPINGDSERNYLFFRMLSLIDFCLSELSLRDMEE